MKRMPVTLSLSQGISRTTRRSIPQKRIRKKAKDHCRSLPGSVNMKENIGIVNIQGQLGSMGMMYFGATLFYIVLHGKNYFCLEQREGLSAGPARIASAAGT